MSYSVRIATLFGALASLLAPFDLSASAKVSELYVKDGVAYFSTDETKSHNLPSCVFSVKGSQWAIDLKSRSGQIIYSSLLTAIANNLSVSVESALDCNASPGVERPSSLALIPSSSR